ncbi:MAG: methyltransferase domain-containing protein [Pirellulaceae bacterium]|nr:methyltransferase domain-containing protein [Pirellulaceae bacterium]
MSLAVKSLQEKHGAGRVATKCWRELCRPVKKLARAISALGRAKLDFASETHYIQHRPARLGQDEFRKLLLSGEFFQRAPAGLQSYLTWNAARLYRILHSLLICGEELAGPTLDVASGNGILYPLLKRCVPSLLPYSIAELRAHPVEIEGQEIPCYSFECEKSTLPLADASQGCVLFCDTIEHLIVDPVWPILEFNRVLQPGGKLVITTPNAAGVSRAARIFYGLSGATENDIKPAAIYQRHNREWTVDDLVRLADCCGFGKCVVTTHSHLITPAEDELLQSAHQLGLLARPKSYFGPEIFLMAEKTAERNLDMEVPRDQRWPTFLYSSHDEYRRRPQTFPIQVGPDYA